MASEIKLHVTIPADRRLDLALPDEVTPGPAEVSVKTAAERGGDEGRRRLAGIDRGRGWIAEDFDAPFLQSSEGAGQQSTG